MQVRFPPGSPKIGSWKVDIGHWKIQSVSILTFNLLFISKFIAILSDSHGGLDRFRLALENLRAAKIQTVLHAGDFVAGDIVELLKNFPEINFWITLGNCDIDEKSISEIQKLPNIKLAEKIEVTLGGRKFAMAHRIEDLRKSDAEVLVSGHTHIARIQKLNNQLRINPGSLFESGMYLILDSEKLTLTGKTFSEKI